MISATDRMSGLTTGLSRQFLADSLPLARRWAKELCRHVDHSGIGCEASHGIWQVLRLLDMGTTPEHHLDFFVHRLRALIRAGARRVLISGTADYAMPAIVYAAFAQESVTGDITVLDVCETPLRLCQWHADRVGVTIDTVTADVMVYDPSEPFEIICTHSFFGLFSPQLRSRLVARWHDMLVPGGAVLTVNRLRPAASARVGFSAAEAEDFYALIAQGMRSHGIIDERDIAETLDLARRYTDHRVVYPVATEQELAAPFRDNGFIVDIKSAAPLDHPMTGPTLRGGATYAMVVAKRER